VPRVSSYVLSTRSSQIPPKTNPPSTYTRHLLQSPLSITSTQYPLHSPICNPVPPSPTILPQNSTQPNIKAFNTQHKTLKPLDTSVESPPITCTSQKPPLFRKFAAECYATALAGEAMTKITHSTQRIGLYRNSRVWHSYITVPRAHTQSRNIPWSQSK